MKSTLRTRLRRLYFGSSPTSRTFRLFSLIGEILLVTFFIATTFVADDNQSWIYYADLAIAALLAADFIARWIMTQPSSVYFRQLSTWGDIVVLATLVLPVFAESLLFLRVLRAVRLFRSYHILRELYREYAFVQRNRDAIQAALNLLVFVFVMSAIVYVLEVRRHDSINNFIDALYFTVSTLSTTGFGDITFKDPTGRLLSIFIMIVGVGLFLRLIQAIFRPSKVRYECPVCGLLRHDPDAVHCKHCGKVLHIQTEGAEL
jgi:voltage-gated potassium channel